MKSKQKKIRVLSPDGFTIEFGVESYKNMTEAKKAFTKWAQRFEQQGYYSSASHGRIDLLDLIDFCQFIEV